MLEFDLKKTRDSLIFMEKSLFCHPFSQLRFYIKTAVASVIILMVLRDKFLC